MTMTITRKQIAAMMSTVTIATAAWYQCHHLTQVPEQSPAAETT